MKKMENEILFNGPTTVSLNSICPYLHTDTERSTFESPL